MADLVAEVEDIIASVREGRIDVRHAAKALGLKFDQDLLMGVFEGYVHQARSLEALLKAAAPFVAFSPMNIIGMKRDSNGELEDFDKDSRLTEDDFRALAEAVRGVDPTR